MVTPRGQEEDEFQGEPSRTTSRTRERRRTESRRGGAGGDNRQGHEESVRSDGEGTPEVVIMLGDGVNMKRTGSRKGKGDTGCRAAIGRKVEKPQQSLDVVKNTQQMLKRHY